MKSSKIQIDVIFKIYQKLTTITISFVKQTIIIFSLSVICSIFSHFVNNHYQYYSHNINSQHIHSSPNTTYQQIFLSFAISINFIFVDFTSFQFIRITKFVINIKLEYKMFQYFVMLAVLLSLGNSEVNLYYLYDNVDDGMKINESNPGLPPINKVDCAKYDCSSFHANSIPAMIRWGGPGSSFKQLPSPTLQSAQQFMKKWESNPLHPLRSSIQSMGFMPQTILIAIGVNIFLTLIFGYLFGKVFAPKSQLEQIAKTKDQ